MQKFKQTQTTFLVFLLLFLSVRPILLSLSISSYFSCHFEIFKEFLLTLTIFMFYNNVANYHVSTQEISEIHCILHCILAPVKAILIILGYVEIILGHFNLSLVYFNILKF